MDYSLRSDLTVIATNPELADYDNPHGHIYGEATYITATADDGTRLHHRCQSIRNTLRNTELTEFTVARLQTLADYLSLNQPELNMAHWFPMEPEYGSPAWQEQEPAMARREQADCLFNEAL